MLAGTVVVGGKQDRQVGQDFVIPPYKTVTKKAKAKEVQGFVTELRKAAVKEKKKTKGGNENRYRETDKGFASDCVIDVDGEAMPVTSDFLYK